jgi:hypothetical protein
MNDKNILLNVLNELTQKFETYKNESVNYKNKTDKIFYDLNKLTCSRTHMSRYISDTRDTMVRTMQSDNQVRDYVGKYLSLDLHFDDDDSIKTALEYIYALLSIILLSRLWIHWRFHRKKEACICQSSKSTSCFPFVICFKHRQRDFFYCRKISHAGVYTEAYVKRRNVH